RFLRPDPDSSPWDQRSEDLAALLVVAELVVTGAGGRQQDHIAGLCGVRGLGNRRGEIARSPHGDGALEVSLQPVRGLSDQVRRLRPRGERVAQPLEAAALEAPAED